jgi:outer membrane receptor for ferrienterochelin and colicins
LILVDSERLAGETYGDIDYSHINMADVERIEVVKGAKSTLYGPNALGGFVHIINKNPVKELSVAVSARFTDRYFKIGIDNLFDYIDPSGGYNTGHQAGHSFLGLN